MNLDSLIDEVIIVTSDDYEKCVLFMIHCLPLIADACPEIGGQGIRSATQYWIDESIDQAELERMRVECWNYLDANSASTNLEKPEFCAIRAVICVLYSEPQSDDNGELLDWFFKMLTSIYIDTEKLMNDLKGVMEEFIVINGVGVKLS